MAYIFDIGIVVLLAFFAWRGAARGLMMSLCALAAVFVAFFAARFVSDTFCVQVAGIIRPVIAESIEDAARGIVQGLEDIPAEGEEYAYTAKDLLGYLKENELFQGLSDYIERAVADDVLKRGSPVSTLTGFLSKGIAKVALFGAVFLCVQIIWFLLSHTLDLKLKLPILAELNLAGGLVFGLAKGVLLTIVLVWLGQVSGVVPGQPDTPVLTLFTVDGLNELLANLPA